MVENSEKSCLVGLSDLSLKMGFMDMATNVEQSQSVISLHWLLRRKRYKTLKEVLCVLLYSLAA